MIEKLQNQGIPNDVKEIIIMDASRSLYIHSSNITQATLEEMLYLYALMNPTIGYCQGMNYLMGFLYLTIGLTISNPIERKKITVQCFISLINNYFADVFSDGLKGLKQIFYQFDKCLCIFLPELAEHFKKERIDSNYYAPCWIMTVFSCAMQYSEASFLLMEIWDIFLIDGWKGFLRTALTILDQFRPIFLTKQFDYIVKNLNDFYKGGVFNIPFGLTNEQQQKVEEEYQYIFTLKQTTKKIQLSNLLVQKLVEDYQSFLDVVSEKLEKIKDQQFN